MYTFCRIVGLLPYRVLFVLSDLVYVILYYVVRYRRAVVALNLRNSFPTKTDGELKVIERKFYHQLADVMVETISMARASERQIRRRMVFTNAGEVERETEGRSWISMMGHYGSWEFTTSYSLYASGHGVLAVYRPLYDKNFDNMYRRLRSRWGVEPVPMKDIVREVLLRNREKRYVAIAMIADQTPPRSEIQNWTYFLNRDTPFFMGSEKLALKLHLPVYFLRMKKVKRGHYEGTFVQIYDGREAVAEHEITRRYAAELEAMICEAPELWMWSHKRWKHHKEDFVK